jgi:hypothetical protein
MTEAKSLSALLQWQAKSVSVVHPSEPSEVRKQLRAQPGMFSSWAVPTEARATNAAMVKDFILTVDLVLFKLTVAID